MPYVRNRRHYPTGRAKAVMVDWARVAELAAAGMNARQILDALQLGGTPGTLKHRAAGRGIAIRRATKAEVAAACSAERAVWTAEKESRLIALWAAGVTAEAIARDLGTSGYTVRRKAELLNLPPRVPAPAPARKQADCLPVPRVTGPVWPAITRLLEAA